jgi:hypothetical protein
MCFSISVVSQIICFGRGVSVAKIQRSWSPFDMRQRPGPGCLPTTSTSASCASDGGGWVMTGAVAAPATQLAVSAHAATTGLIAGCLRASRGRPRSVRSTGGGSRRTSRSASRQPPSYVSVLGAGQVRATRKASHPRPQCRRRSSRHSGSRCIDLFAYCSGIRVDFRPSAWVIARRHTDPLSHPLKNRGDASGPRKCSGHRSLLSNRPLAREERNRPGVCRRCACRPTGAWVWRLQNQTSAVR